MRLLYLLLLSAMVSCTNKPAEENKAARLEQEGNVIDIIIKDTSAISHIEVKVEVGIPNIDNLRIFVTNNSGKTIAICDRYRISALEAGEDKLQFERSFDAPVLIPAGKGEEIIINLELDKVRYSKKTQYKFNTYYRTGDAEGGAVSELSCLFRTPEMWQEGKSLTLMPDTMIDH